MCEPFGAMLPQKSLSNQKRAEAFRATVRRSSVPRLP